MTELRIATLRAYGVETHLADASPSPAERGVRIRVLAENRAREFDPNSLIGLGRALLRFDVEPLVARVRAPCRRR